jgi:hypothetical protein
VAHITLIALSSDASGSIVNGILGHDVPETTTAFAVRIPHHHQ